MGKFMIHAQVQWPQDELHVQYKGAQALCLIRLQARASISVLPVM